MHPRTAHTIVASDPPVEPSAAGHPESGTAAREGVILLVLAALQFVGIVDFMIVMPLGPQLLDDLAIDARRFSWVVSAYTLTAGHGRSRLSMTGGIEGGRACQDGGRSFPGRSMLASTS